MCDEAEENLVSLQDHCLSVLVLKKSLRQIGWVLEVECQESKSAEGKQSADGEISEGIDGVIFSSRTQGSCGEISLQNDLSRAKGTDRAEKKHRSGDHGHTYRGV